MAINERDGFKFYSVLHEPYGSLIIEKDRIAECVAYMNSTGFSRAAVKSEHGFTIDDIGFLNDIEHRFQISLGRLDGDNLSVLDGNPNIVALTLSSEIKEFPLGSLPNLQEAYLGWNKSLFSRGMPSNLTKLHLYRVRSPVADLSQFPSSKSLRELALLDSRSITSIAGIERNPNLQWIEFSYLPKLTDIAPLVCFDGKGKLNFLHFNHCKGVGQWGVLARLKTVRTLYIHDCKIGDLGFVPAMSSLDHFRFVETSVADGDLSPLLKSSTLHKVAFSNKKNFNLKEADIIHELENR